MAMAWAWLMEDFWNSFSRAVLSMVLLLRLITGASLEPRWIEVRGVFEGVVAVEAVLFLEAEEAPEILKKAMVVCRFLSVFVCVCKCVWLQEVLGRVCSLCCCFGFSVVG